MWTIREPATLARGDVWEVQLDSVLAHKVIDMTAYKRLAIQLTANVRASAFHPPRKSTALAVLPRPLVDLAVIQLRYALKANYKGYKSKEVVAGRSEAAVRFRSAST